MNVYISSSKQSRVCSAGSVATHSTIKLSFVLCILAM